MLDALSDALARQIFETHAADRSHAGADLDGIPPLVALALRQRLEREAGTRLDAVSPWLSTRPETWRDEAMAEARFPSYAWKPAVRETCAALLAALVAPSEALPKQLIPDGSATTKDVLGGLKGLGAYPYLAEIVRRYVEKKDLEVFEQEELSHLLSRIDRRVAGELGVDGWMALLTPLYEVIGGIPEQDGDVPGRVLAEAFAARGCPGLGTAVVSEMEVSRDTLRTILADALATDAPLAPAPTPPEAEVFAVATGGPHSDAPETDADADDAQILAEAEPLAAADDSAAEETELESLAPETETEVPAPDEPDPEPLAPEAKSASASDLLAALIDADDDEEEALQPADDVLMGANGRPETDAPELTEPLAPLLTVPAPAEDPEPTPEAASEPAPELEMEPESAEDTTEDGETLLDRLARQSSQTPEADEPRAPRPPAAGDPLWKQFAHAGASQAPASTPTLHQAMSAPASSAPLEDHEAFVLGEAASNREWYTEHLFGGDPSAYARVLAQLSGSRSWTDATQIIGREVFRRYTVDIYSEPAVSFTDAVESRLRPA